MLSVEKKKRAYTSIHEHLQQIEWLSMSQNKNNKKINKINRSARGSGCGQLNLPKREDKTSDRKQEV